MNVEELVRKYTPGVNIMQLATSVNNHPWICTVHFYSDEALNFIWCSNTDRRHSEELKQNQQAAAYILIHENTPDEDYVIGVSIMGVAELIGSKIEEKIGQGFVKKLRKEKNYLEDIASGIKPSRFYKLTPKLIVLFDNKNFPNNPRQEWQIGEST
ncbi:MAG TPA: pyridoxamine 5'-phosphate oxidase family protein [Candidatus Saccharimonadales bacterium]|nr:pyridoxamine 5'-phosphate oxidase family protein [Candidatus Saccharimonadales bacterium]